jgi:NTE family protein
MDQPAPRTAFVLAGGGSFGAVQVGMLKALTAHGVVPDLIVGSSVGALNGAYFAADPTAAGAAELEAIWRSLRRQDVFPITWRTMLGALRRKTFLVDPDGLRRLVARHLPYRNLEEAKVPIRIVTTNVLTGEAVVLAEGPASEAIIASAAIPAAFAPVRVQSRYLFDGSVTSNTPVKVAVACGARRIVVLPTGFACALDSPPYRAIECALHALTLLIARQLAAELVGLEAGIACAIVPPLCPLRGSPFDFSQCPELIDRAADSTAKWLAAGGLEQHEVPHQLLAHGHSH